MNKVILLGRLGRNVETKLTTNGKQVSNFSLATTESKDVTDWHNVTCWGKTAEIAQAYLAKGKLALVEGKVKTDSWEKDGVKQYKTYILADRIELIAGQNVTAEETQAAPTAMDEIPF
jgi:single-strand DNA-binding protein